MARNPVKSLQDALRDIERDIDIRANELELRRQHAQTIRGLIAFYGTEAEGQAPQESLVPNRQGGSRTPRSEAKVARNAMYNILRAAEGPMHSRDLLSALNEQGIVVEGKDPVNNVRSHLSHDARFVPVGGGDWDLASRANGATSGSGWAPVPRAALTAAPTPSEPAAEDESPPLGPTEDGWPDDPFADELLSELRNEMRDELAHSAS